MLNCEQPYAQLCSVMRHNARPKSYCELGFTVCHMHKILTTNMSHYMQQRMSVPVALEVELEVLEQLMFTG